MGDSWSNSSAKRWFDFTSAFLLLVISLPICTLIAALIKLTSHGPILFTQKRLGKGGKPFRLYKFRTMIPGAEKLQKKLKYLNEANGPVFKIRHDPRFTKIGKYLANTGLDELPQLLNVLKGEMSLVGPRPLPLNEAKEIPLKWRAKRESVKPGIVSSWVIKGSHQLSFAQWMQLDLGDLKNTLSDDLHIIHASAKMILKQILRNIGLFFK